MLQHPIDDTGAVEARHVTRNVLSEDATYLVDALTALAILDADVPRQLEPELQQVVDLLRDDGRAALLAAYARLVAVMGEVTERRMRNPHPAHTSRLVDVAHRLRHERRVVPGLTTHQAKGREWDRVGLRLSGAKRPRWLRGWSSPMTRTGSCTSLVPAPATGRSKSDVRAHSQDAA